MNLEVVEKKPKKVKEYAIVCLFCDTVCTTKKEFNQHIRDFHLKKFQPKQHS